MTGLLAGPVTDPSGGAPVVCADRDSLEQRLAPARERATRIGLVPTMGALHEGHLSLLEAALRRCGHVVVSIFVNPLQFGPGEDFERYPRSLDADLAALDAALSGRADCSVYVPAVAELYPYGLDGGVAVEPGRLGQVLEGAIRPTHFRGVLTVVAKLFGLVRPQEAWFGEKDYQQLVLIRRMADELALGLEVCGAPIVREPDGLALSSRNVYLDAAQRQLATALPRALERGVAEAARTGAGALAIEAAATSALTESGLDPDYVAVTDPGLGPAPRSGPARLLVAARVGSTRLLDNAGLVLGGGRQPAGPNRAG
ncbi:MAG: pantoate/beta-alanine ligase [Nocardioidaceae bacterium]|nr:pantoate/beta-alanine ligase [Nocardioidaceae bacterium]